VGFFIIMKARKPWTECAKLNSGVLIPTLGYGTYMVSSSKPILQALQVGYTHLDTAQYYENHAEVGEAVSKSGLKRDEIFVTSKVWHSNSAKGNYQYVIKECNNALKQSGLDYFDLYLLHSPHGSQVKERYKALVDLQKAGKILSYGVSNFGVDHLKALKTAGLPTPAVNQIELHPLLQQKEIVAYCEKEGILIEAYSPLAKGSSWLLNHKELKKIARAHSKTVAQVLIRWSLQRGYICLPKSSNKARVVENFDVSDWALTKDDMKLIAGLDEERHCTWDPTSVKIDM